MEQLFIYSMMVYVVFYQLVYRLLESSILSIKGKNIFFIDI